MVLHPVDQEGLEPLDVHRSEDYPPCSTRPRGHALRHLSYICVAIQLSESSKGVETLKVDKGHTRCCGGNAAGPKDSMDRVFSYGGNASSGDSCIGSVFFECNVWFHLRTIAVVLVHKKGLFVNPVLTSHMWVGCEAGHMPGGIR